ncbi:hypothetical protein JOB18_013820 [Solea senegalensis]|nr:hypothetical protein JOB18_013820 [Solea senegalensis]
MLQRLRLAEDLEYVNPGVAFMKQGQQGFPIVLLAKYVATCGANSSVLQCDSPGIRCRGGFWILVQLK